jgi:Ca2+-binding RTX toxin-like protein
MKKGLLAGVIGLVWALVVASGALASTVTITGGNTVRVSETGSEVNRVVVSFASGTDLYTARDTVANLAVAGATCTAVDAHTATCPGAGIKTVSVDTDAQNDSIVLASSIPSTVMGNLDGGGGNDSVSGHGTVNGGSGDDVVTGSALADNIRGGSGRDSLNGGDGPDDIAGGSGTDTLFYPADRATPISVTVGAGDGNDGGIEDQGSGKRDTVQGDVEGVAGTPQGDLIGGDSSGEMLIGGLGDDTLVGNNGNDTLLGLEGNDLLFGGNGHDLLRGWLGADRLFGGANGDTVSGGPDDDLVVGNRGRDALKGKGGIDVLMAKDGARDRKIRCGPGANKRERAKRDKRLDPKPSSC